MLGKRNMRDSIGYVTLGLFSNALLNELQEAANNPSCVPKNRDMIDLAIDSLTETLSPKSISRPRFAELVFQRHQEANALRKTMKSPKTNTNLNKMTKVLNKIVKDNVTANERSKSIKEAVDFFRELARTSITQAECPEERIPPGVAQLAY
jgi:hypothetical protein